MTQTFQRHDAAHLVAPCATCDHDGAEHIGACRTDVFINRRWAKCRCPTFIPSEH
jgi:hypothetical protein